MDIIIIILFTWVRYVPLAAALGFFLAAAKLQAFDVNKKTVTFCARLAQHNAGVAGRITHHPRACPRREHGLRKRRPQAAH